jgi:D-beta-D-heptose 7-phosphate kinase/D-beta-D-heptose 1-phosphate adenosyltransferase
MKIVLVTGGFDPLHSGHISYLNHADHLGEHVVVGLNSDDWLTRKKGRPFMSWHERMVVLSNLHMVGEIIAFDDSDGTACDAIRRVQTKYPNDQIIFANGGDRTATNIPEMVLDNVDFVFGVGGDTKINSSGWVLDEWKAPKTQRPWGYYRVLHEVPGTKVKELTIMPGQSLSMQRHAHRAEHWHVTHGACTVFSTMPNGYALPVVLLSEHMNYHVPRGEWHQLTNPYEIPCKIVEIQYGDACTEEDIQRR